MTINYGMEIVRATEIAALTAARYQGIGDRYNVLNRARTAIIKTLDRLHIEGTVKNDRFFKRDDIVQIPSTLGQGGQKMDLMAMALEGHHSTAQGRNNSTSYAVIAKKGEMAQPGMMLFRIVNPEDIRIKSDVSERFIGKFKKGDPVTVYFPSQDE